MSIIVHYSKYFDKLKDNANMFFLYYNIKLNFCKFESCKYYFI